MIDVAWSEVAGGLKVTLSADGEITTGRYRYFRLESGAPREVVKLLGVNRGFTSNQMTVDGPGVRRIRFGFHRNVRELHVVMDLAGPRWGVTEVEIAGSRLELTVSRQ